MIEGSLVAGSDGGDDHNGRIVFSVVLAAEDLTEVHTSSSEAHGSPKDSGRAELTGLTVAIIYICHLIKWYGLNDGESTIIDCDNQEAVKKWADLRNVELKLTLKNL